MDKSEKLKNAILNEYKSIREFSKIVDIPNSTIVSAIDKGIGGMAVDKVIRMCDILNLDVKTFDKIPYAKKNELTQKETNLLISFNKLNDIGQHEASKRVEELTCVDKYIKELPKQKEIPDYLQPVAAHLDGDLTDEIKDFIDKL